MLQSDSIICWERASGIREIRLVHQRPITAPGYALKRLALDKLARIGMVSAEFDGEFILFERAASVLVDAGSSAYCDTVYASAPESDSAPSKPAFCLRRAKYDRDKDYRSFAGAANKSEYVLHSQVIDSEFRFCASSEAGQIPELLARAYTMLREGIGLRKVTRAHHATGGLVAAFDFGDIHMKLSYMPMASGNDQLDAWFRDWQACFENMAQYEYVVPDLGRIRVSYNTSLFDRLERVGDQRG